MNNIPDTTTYSGWAIDNSFMEQMLKQPLTQMDDGLNNQSEFNLGSDPNDNDTSNDGLSLIKHSLTMD